MKNKVLLVAFLFILSCSFCFASDIRFSGGYTKVSLQDGNRTVELTGGAKASTDSISIEADRVFLYGEDYRYTDCTGNITVHETEHNLEIKATSLFYDREDESLLSNGWIEIDDTENEAQLSGAWFEYSIKNRIMVLQMKASIKKVTERGMLTCSADSIEYNAEKQTLELRGNADVSWGSDNYKASYIMVEIETEEVILQGSISGEING